MLGGIDMGHHLRAAPRYKLFQPTDISIGSVAKRVHILNLSVGGALIYANDPPVPGTVLRLRCGARTLPARVAWKDERRFGVTFLSPIAPSDVRDVIAAQDALVAAASQGARASAAQDHPARGTRA